MKKLFSILTFSIALMLFVSSCSSDETIYDEDGNETTTVSLSVGVNGIDPLTRAFSDGTKIKTYQLVVLNMDNSPVFDEPQTSSLITGGEGFELTVSKGKKYKLAFWANGTASTAYNLNNDATVTVDYTKMKNNDEDSDAFYGTAILDATQIPAVLEVYKGNLGDTINPTVVTAGRVELTRAVTRVSFGLDPFDVTSVLNTTLAADAYPIFNILTGDVEGVASSSTFAMNTTPTGETFTAADGIAYRVISSSYFFAKKTQENVKVTFGMDLGDSTPLSVSLKDIPVRRNYHTQIVFSFKTTADILVDHSPNFKGVNNENK